MDSTTPTDPTSTDTTTLEAFQLPDDVIASHSFKFAQYLSNRLKGVLQLSDADDKLPIKALELLLFKGIVEYMEMSLGEDFGEESE
jgi:hypothetical protein